MMRKYEKEELEAIAAAKDFMNGYRMCRDLLGLRQYERKREAARGEESGFADVMAGDEAFWRARMHAVGSILGKMKNGREKLMLYYHFIKGYSVEHIAVRLGVSRRTGFRILDRGLLMVSQYTDGMRKSCGA